VGRGRGDGHGKWGEGGRPLWELEKGREMTVRSGELEGYGPENWERARDPIWEPGWREGAGAGAAPGCRQSRVPQPPCAVVPPLQPGETPPPEAPAPCIPPRLCSHGRPPRFGTAGASLAGHRARVLPAELCQPHPKIDPPRERALPRGPRCESELGRGGNGGDTGRWWCGWGWGHWGW